MGCVSCFHNLLWCIIHLSAPAMSCPEAVCRFLGGPSPSLPTPQLGDRATELFHREMLARGAVCCLPPPATPFACYLPCFTLPQLPLHRRDGAGPALGMPMAFFFTLQTVLNCSHLKGQVWERSCFACSKKVFPKSNIYAMRVP